MVQEHILIKHKADEEKGGIKVIEAACEKLALNHESHIDLWCS